MSQPTCRECGEAIIGRQVTAVYCSRLCGERSKGRAKYRRNHPQSNHYFELKGLPCIIEGCDRPTLARRLCYTHYRAQRRAEGATWALGGGKGNARARARYHGAQYENIDPLEVYERDRWTCGICDQPVESDLDYPHPMSVSLDHVVPLARGGHHTLDNVQCSHLRCNLLKQDRLAS